MKPRNVVLVLAFLAFFAKLYCAATTFGTTDALTFLRFGIFIDHFGLIEMYKATQAFNHTPLIGWFSEACFRLAKNDPQEPYIFNFYLRLPVIFADLFTVLALVWLREKTGRPSWWAIGLLAASPVSFMVSGFHGNVDSLMVLGLVLAAVAATMERPALSGLFLGLSCNFKIIPIFLVPAFCFFWWERRKIVRFSIPTAAVVLAGWSYPLLTIPFVFKRNVLDYSSVWGVWGITYGLNLTHHPALSGLVFTGKTVLQEIITTILKVIIIVLVLFIAWKRRKAEPIGIFKTLALSWCVFFVFAPGFGAQYLLWFAPFLLMANERWFAGVTAVSSAALFVFYTGACRGQIPWDRAWHPLAAAPQWMPWFILPWLVLAGYLVRTLQLHFAAVPRPEAGAELIEACGEA